MGVDLIRRNLRLYGWYQTAAGLLFWLPTSILFFIERVGLGSTLRLAAVYFLAVVVAEVPSGWLSDSRSRVLALRLAAASWIIAFSIFLMAGSSTWFLAAGQVFVALGFAFKSGTDQAFHYDSLEALGKEGSFGARESGIGRNVLLATTAAAVIGGALGLVDLRLPFAAALIGAVVQLFVGVRLTEPPRPDDVVAQKGIGGAPEPGQLSACLAYVRRPGIAWLFVFLTVQQPLEGLALDLVQPWLTLLTGAALDDAGLAPLYSGIVIGVISLVGAAAATRAEKLRSAWGARRVLFALALVQTLIISGMALAVTPWLILLISLRSTQIAIAPIVVAASLAPHVRRSHRATLLSLGSLSGRLAYGLILLAIGSTDDLSVVLATSSLVGLGALIVLGGAHFLLPDDLSTES